MCDIYAVYAVESNEYVNMMMRNADLNAANC